MKMMREESEKYEYLAALARSAVKKYPRRGYVKGKALAARLKNDLGRITIAYKTARRLEKSAGSLPAAFEWIADNYYVLEDKALTCIRSAGRLGRVQGTSGGLPRFYLAFLEYVRKTDEAVDRETVDAFIGSAAQADAPGYSDFYSFELLFTCAVISLTASVCDDIIGHPYEENLGGAASAIGKCVVSVKYVANHQFENGFEKSVTEQYMRLDPSGYYPHMTRETKDYYRSRVSLLSKKEGKSETDYVKGLLEKARLASEADERHIGYYLYPKRSALIKAAYFSLLALLTAFACAFLCRFTLFALLLVFPLWEASKQIADRLFSAFVKAPPLPRLDISRLPDTDGVLVVITTLLFGGKGDDEIFSRLEKIYLSNCMENVYFGVLGDYSDSAGATTSKDSDILEGAVGRIEALNAKYGSRFFLFMRERSYSKTQGGFVCYERKRGAVTSLVRFLCGKDNPFIEQSASMPRSLCDSVRYVITLDSDTNLPIDGVKDLAGIMLHPLNRPVIDKERHIVTRGYGIMQPRVAPELSASLKTPFSRVMCGSGGIDVYASAQFDLYQSVFGEAVFCGKGIFDKYAFDEVINCAETEFPDDTILSHDILEGARLRTAMVSDVEVTDGFPKTVLSYFKRHHRWVRGDVQNLIFLFGSFRNKSGKETDNNISALSKFKLFDNFRRELSPVFSFALIIASSFFDGKKALALSVGAILYLLLPFLFDFADLVGTLGFQCAARRYFSKGVTSGIWQSFMRMIIGIAMLPKNAFVTLDALIRSLWRMKISHKNMLEWVTAAQSDASSDDGLLYYVQKNLAGAFIGVLMFIFSPYGALKLIGLSWFFFPAAAYLCSSDRSKSQNISAAEREKLKQYAKDMWGFFESTVTEDDNYLPIDNLQLFPTQIPARRTSPTNIGLYLLCVLSAREMGFIDTDEMSKRLSDTLSSLERADKWNGHLYNWYSTTDLSVLEPRYVSSVDSGNFCACLIALKEGIKEYAFENTGVLDIVSRIEKMLDETDIAKLYNSSRELFSLGIGFDGEKAVMSDNCYDMLMSEARTLSYIALAYRKVPKKHFSRLARPLVKLGDRVGLASWTGTAFEYFMPALFMPHPKGSLSYEALRFAFYCQRKRTAFTEKAGDVWGISESGYYSFDSDMNYRYRAFGVPRLGFKRGLEKDLVISPYSSFLCTCLSVRLPLANLAKLSKSGAVGEFGFYEAIDFTPERCADTSSGAVVKSYMAHHVGMSMIACSNACLDGNIRKYFMRDAKMRSASEILEEKIPVNAVVRKLKNTAYSVERPERRERPGRLVTDCVGFSGPRCAAVSDGLASIVASDNGYVAMKVGKNAVNAAANDVFDAKSGFFCFFSIDGKTYSTSLLPLENDGIKYSFETSGGLISHIAESDSFKASSSYTVMSERSVIRARFSAEAASAGSSPFMDVCFCFEPVLGNLSDHLRHPAFSSLFVGSEYDEASETLIFTRRPRTSGEKSLYLAVGLLDKGQRFDFVTRKQSAFSTPMRSGDYEGIFDVEYKSETGACISPLCAVRTRAERIGGEFSAELLISVAASYDRAKSSIEEARRESFSDSFEKTESIGALMAVGTGKYVPQKAIEKVCSDILSKIIYPSRCIDKNITGYPSGRENLWEMGISGDLPIIVVDVQSESLAKNAEKYVRAFVLLRKKNVFFDIVFLCRDTEIYSRPSESAVMRTVENLGASGYLKKRGGGIFTVNPSLLSDRGSALFAYASAVLDTIDDGQSMPVKAEKYDVRTAPDFSTEAAVPYDCELKSGCGYFDKDGGYTVIKREKLSAPYSFVLSGGAASCVLTHNSLGYTFMSNSALRRITPFRNDAISDMEGERVFLHSEEKYFDLAACSQAVHYETGCARYIGVVSGYEYEMLVYMPEKTGVKVIDLSLGRMYGESGGSGDEIIFSAKPVMGEREDENRRCCFKVTDDRIEFSNGYSEYFSEYTGFIGIVHDKADYFVGEGGVFDLCAVGRLKISDIKSEKGGKKVRMAIGAYRSASEKAKIFVTEKLRDTEGALYESARSYSESFLPHFEIKADPSDVPLYTTALMFNRYLAYQNGICRFKARSGFYQSGGAYGFRDQLQDCVMLMYANSDAAKAHIIRAAAHQFIEGDVLHWWHETPPTQSDTIEGAPFHRGIRSECSDDYIWLVYAACEYARYTGDKDIFDIKVRYISGEKLSDGETEKYIRTARSDVRESLYMHCARVLDRAYSRLGEKGLAKLGSGDWSDGLNKAGEKLIGESVWLSMFLCLVTRSFINTAGDRMSDDEAKIYREKADKIEKAVTEHGYDRDSGYFARAWYDDGTPIGVGKSDECKIDLLPQAFAALSGIGGADCILRSVEASYRELFDEQSGIFKLLTPPFDKTPRDPGYIKGYVKGIRENGGQYTHAAVWGSMALFEAANIADRDGRDGEKYRRWGVGTLLALNPSLRCTDREKSKVYALEPYVLAGDVYSNPDFEGRGGWSWYTGSAGWMWREVLECVIGVRITDVSDKDKASLLFTENAFKVPQMLSDGFEAVLKFDNICAEYEIICKKGKEEQILLDGKETDLRVPLKRGKHRVEITGV